MLETIDNWINTAGGWLDIIPIEAWAVVGGLFIGFAITQWIKRNFPIKALLPNLSAVKHKFAIRLLALVCTALPTFFIWPSDGAQADNRYWAAIAVGFGAPIFYKVFSFFLYKKWPDLKGRMSGTS